MYKLNQVEAAIGKTRILLGYSATNVSMTVKRLRNADRALATTRRSPYPRAFESDKGSGAGTDTQFSGYDAFALCLASQLLDHAFSQTDVTSIFLQHRALLEAAHSRIARRTVGWAYDPRSMKPLPAGQPLLKEKQLSYFVVERAPAATASWEAYVETGESKLLRRIHNLPVSVLALDVFARLMQFFLEDIEPTKRGRS